MLKEDYVKLLEKYKQVYTPELMKIRKEYQSKIYNISDDQFIELSKRYRFLIFSLIKNVVEDLKKYYDLDVMVSVNGSLARATNTIYSDIDINFLSDKDDERLIEFEDKVNYILKEVMLFKGKDKIHSMVVYLPLISNVQYPFIKENKYPIKFENGTIYSTCRSNAEKLMFESYNSTRNVIEVAKYFNKHDTEQELNEWTYCYKTIISSESDVLFESQRTLFRKKDGLNKHINNAKLKIEKDNLYLSEEDNQLRNCDVKKAYKSKVLFNIYNILAIVYRLNSKIKEFDFDEFASNDDVLEKEYYTLIIQYLKIIQTLQMILDEMNIDLSSHSSDYLDIQRINEEYQKLTGSQNIISDLNNKKRNIYQESYNALERIRRNYGKE